MRIQSFFFSCIIFVSFISATVVEEPTKISWDTLKDVTYKKKWNAELSMYFLQPTFGQNLKKLEGKEVVIKGYMIPVDAGSNTYMLSAFPYSMCFFCGGAGPESVVDIRFKGKPSRFKTDEIRPIRGKLQLNDSNVEEMTYILKDATLED